MRVGVVAAFRSAPQSGIDADDLYVEASLAHHLTQLADAASAAATHLDKPCAVLEMGSGFFLMATQLKPAGYIAPRARRFVEFAGWQSPLSRAARQRSCCRVCRRFG